MALGISSLTPEFYGIYYFLDKPNLWFKGKPLPRLFGLGLIYENGLNNSKE